MGSEVRRVFRLRITVRSLPPRDSQTRFVRVSLLPTIVGCWQLTGEGSGEGRRALAATVSFAGEVVEPHSLSAAVDVTPGDQGGGPLGSAVLVEQLKRAGALKEVRVKTDIALVERRTVRETLSRANRRSRDFWL